MIYPKIKTLFERLPNCKVDTSKLENPAFEWIKAWRVTEKIDGMNIRIVLSSDGKVSFYGRTNNAVLPKGLLYYFENSGIYTPENLRSAWMYVPEDIRKIVSDSSSNMIFIGEGYGNNIQKNGYKYNSNYSFRLFDIYVGNYSYIGTWIDWLDIETIAQNLKIPIVPNLGIYTLDEIVSNVKDGFISKVSLQEGQPRLAEGIVARTDINLYFRNGKRLMFKLKTKDFDVNLKAIEEKKCEEYT